MKIGVRHQRYTPWTIEDVVLDFVDYVERGGDIRSTEFKKTRNDTMMAMYARDFGYDSLLEKAKDVLRGKKDNLVKKLEKYAECLQNPGAYQPKEECQPQKILDAILFYYIFEVPLNENFVRQKLPRLYDNSRNKFGNWGTAVVKATGMPYEHFCLRKKWSKEKIINELIRIARNRKSVRYWALKKKYPELAGAIRRRKFFKTHEEAIEATRKYLLERGEYDVVSKFYYDKIKIELKQGRGWNFRKKYSAPDDEGAETKKSLKERLRECTLEESLIKKLLKNNTGLVVLAAERICAGNKDKPDIIEAGEIGLWKAICTYDGRAKFSTYAVRCIQTEIVKALAQEYTVPMPKQYRAKVRDLKEVMRISEQSGKKPSIEELEVIVELPRDIIESVLLGRGKTRLDGVVDENSKYDLIENRNAEKPVEICEERDEQDHRKAIVSRLLALLDPLEQELIRMRYGLDGVPPRSYAQIIDQLGIGKINYARYKVWMAFKKIRAEFKVNEADLVTS